MMMFSFLAVLYSSLETDRQPSFGGDAANVGEENNAATPRTAIETQLGSAIWSPFDLNSACATISDNTNSNAATNGQSLHTRRHWFAAKNPSWRSRTQSMDAARHPSQGGSCVLGEAQEESANKDTVVAQSQDVSPVPLVLWNRLMALTN